MALIHLLDDDVEVTRACAFLLESLDYEVMCWEAGEIFLSQACPFQRTCKPLLRRLQHKIW